MNRQYVHLSANPATAFTVGQRHGTLMILEINAADMAAAGHLFYISVNGVWLTAIVPTAFLFFPEAISP